MYCFFYTGKLTQSILSNFSKGLPEKEIFIFLTIMVATNAPKRMRKKTLPQFSFVRDIILTNNLISLSLPLCALEVYL